MNMQVENNASPKIRVGLVDDQKLVRDGFAMVLNSHPDIEVVLEAGDGEQALQRLALVPVDVVIMDVRMPKMDGLSATEAISNSTFPHGVSPKIIILTTFDLNEYVMRAIEVGASGFLLKDASPADLINAVHTVYEGNAVIAPTSTKRLISHLSTEAKYMAQVNPDLIASLSAREKEVLSLAAQGYSNTQIAEELFLAEATVKTHIGRIFNKLQVRDRVQAVVVAFQAGLVKPGDF